MNDSKRVDALWSTPGALIGMVHLPPLPVPPVTVAAMTRAVSAVIERVRIPVGVNVLRNDAAGLHPGGRRFPRSPLVVAAFQTRNGK